MPFEFESFPLSGPVLVRPKVFDDNRGFFLELYKHSDFIRGRIPDHFVQDNYSSSSQGTLRGLHFQKYPHAQGKLVLCMQGSIFDVAVDIRKGSPWYGKWISVELSEKNRSMLYVPPGFAHGFQVLSDRACVMYKCTAEYAPHLERGIIWNDGDIGVRWPLPDPILSGKDLLNQRIRDVENDFLYDRSAGS